MIANRASRGVGLSVILAFLIVAAAGCGGASQATPTSAPTQTVPAATPPLAAPTVNPTVLTGPSVASTPPPGGGSPTPTASATPTR